MGGRVLMAEEAPWFIRCNRVGAHLVDLAFSLKATETQSEIRPSKDPHAVTIWGTFGGGFQLCVLVYCVFRVLLRNFYLSVCLVFGVQSSNQVSWFLFKSFRFLTQLSCILLLVDNQTPDICKNTDNGDFLKKVARVENQRMDEDLTEDKKNPGALFDRCPLFIYFIVNQTLCNL